MQGKLIAKYIWIIDTIHRYGHITLRKLNELWVQSEWSEGEPLPRRTWHTYRMQIEEMFRVVIECDPKSFEYFIASGGSEDDTQMRNWLLDSMAISNVLQESQNVSNRILLEDVPSAREHLSGIINALKQNRRIRFDYHSYERTNFEKGVVVEPYFVRIFHQLWYMIGFNIKDNKIKTYSLDRMREVVALDETFTLPVNFDPHDFFKNSYGIMVNFSEPKEIVLNVTPKQAKYLRALPLHHSQKESVGANSSRFHYQMLLTYDLVQKLLSLGADVTVEQPAELRAMMKDALTAALKNYD